MSRLQHGLSDDDPVILALAAVLLQAHETAVAARRDSREFAVPLPELRKLGALETHLRYLLAQEHVEHLVDATKPGSGKREFRRRAHASFEDKSCLALTREGVNWARKQMGSPTGAAAAAKAANVPHLNLPPTPFYERRRRFLQWGPIRLITLGRRARKMENLLTAFQDPGWPPRVPHPPLPGGSHTKERQRDLVRRLNEAQHPHLIRFRSDGDGVYWEPET
jgi:hypothetical protein